MVVPTTTLTFEAAPQPGDFNGDGLVNAADYTVWRDNLNEVEGVLLAGNGNNDGAVDALDYQLWRQSFIGDALMTSSSTRISTPIKAKHRRSSRPARRAAGGVKESPSGPASTVALPGR
ncbi:MAG: dockerin type I domain-containing protein [Planctomycetota bacterium]